MASSSSAAAPPQQLFWPPPAAFTSNAAPPQFWPPPQLNGTAADRYFSAQKEQNAPYTRRRAALVSRAVQAMGTRWWPYQLKEAGAHTLLHGAGEYIAYDTFVEAADQAFDLGQTATMRLQPGLGVVDGPGARGLAQHQSGRHDCQARRGDPESDHGRVLACSGGRR